MKENKSQKVYKIIMLIFLTALITFLITTFVMYKRVEGIIAVGLKGNTSKNSNSEVMNTMEEFKTILQQKYIGSIDEEKMNEGAIKGYVDGLGDKYTEYLTKDEMKALSEETDGKYVGIGVYVANNTENNTILIVGVMKGSPALESGIQAGDILEKIDGTTYTGKQLDDATKVLKGQENTDCTVTVIRDGKELDLKVTRKTITVEHVASKMLNNNIGYIQIDSFDDGVAAKFEENYKTLQGSGMQSLIIDLRSNGGGIVKEATDIASMFTKNGDTVLITKDKNNKEELTKSTRDPLSTDMPIVVLVNESTASASEILSGALRDNYGAQIIGKNSFGKGVIQTVYKLSDGSGLKITTEEYLTPKRTTINKVGIKPDVEIDLTKDENGKYETSEEKDAQLNKAIELLNK